MNIQNDDEYAEMMNMFKTLTIKEAESVLEFIRNLRIISNNNKNHS